MNLENVHGQRPTAGDAPAAIGHAGGFQSERYTGRWPEASGDVTGLDYALIRLLRWLRQAGVQFAAVLLLGIGMQCLGAPFQKLRNAWRATDPSELFQCHIPLAHRAEMHFFCTAKSSIIVYGYIKIDDFRTAKQWIFCRLVPARHIYVSGYKAIAWWYLFESRKKWNYVTFDGSPVARTAFVDFTANYDRTELPSIAIGNGNHSRRWIKVNSGHADRSLFRHFIVMQLSSHNFPLMIGDSIQLDCESGNYNGWCRSSGGKAVSIGNATGCAVEVSTCY